MSHLHDTLFKQGRLSPAVYDKIKAKELVIKEIIEDYKANKSKKTKGDLTAIVDKLIK